MIQINPVQQQSEVQDERIVSFAVHNSMMEDVFVRKLPLIFAAATAALAGGAWAAGPKTHVMNVPLGDGSVAHIEYAGDVAPKVTIAPDASHPVTPWFVDFPSFAGFDRMMAEMNQRTEAMIRQAQAIARNSPAAQPYIAAYGNLPSGGTSTTIVSYSNNGVTCTKTTQVVSDGPGKPPKVSSSESGQCSDSPARANSGPGNPA